MSQESIHNAASPNDNPDKKKEDSEEVNVTSEESVVNAGPSL